MTLRFLAKKHDLTLGDQRAIIDIPLSVQKRAVELRAAMYETTTVSGYYAILADTFEFLDRLWTTYDGESVELLMAPLWRAALGLVYSLEVYCDSDPMYRKQTEQERQNMRVAIGEILASGAPGVRDLRTELMTEITGEKNGAV